jgi:hypothetical protein
MTKQTSALKLALYSAVLSTSVFAATTTAHADPRTATDYQQWVVLNAEGNLDSVFKGLRVSLNTEARALNTPRGAAKVDAMGAPVAEEQNPNTVYILRPAVGYQIAPWITAWVGYAWQPVFYRNEVREDIMEHRLFWQGSGSWTFGQLQIGYRTRLEHRFRATGNGGTANKIQGEDEWAHRFRQQIRFAWTFVEGSPWQAIVADEILIHLNTTKYITEPGIDQNRLFFGVGYQANPETRFEVGYQNQAVHRFTDRQQMNHILLVSMNFKFGGSHAAPAPTPTIVPDAGLPVP